MFAILTHGGDIFPVPLKGDIIPVRSQEATRDLDYFIKKHRIYKCKNKVKGETIL
jgi:hypothetical protein